MKGQFKVPKFSVNDSIGLACVVINLLVIGFVLFTQNSLPPVVPLYYGLPIGDEMLANKTTLPVPALASIIIISINILIIKAIKDVFLQKVLTSIIVLITLLSTITIFKIAFLIGNF